MVKNNLPATHSLIGKVQKTIDTHQLIEKGGRVLVGVSGGPDSMCLIDILMKLSVNSGYRIEVAHLNHSLRGDDSIADEKFVEDFCKTHDLVFHNKTIDIRTLSKVHGTGIEETARVARYAFFEECTAESKMRIAVAHHRQDQVETILLNLIRGCGLDGMAGMDFLNGRIIRPLLDCEKNVIMDYLSFYNIAFRTDRTNLESCADRNRIRLETIPMLDKEFGRNVSASILKTGILCRQDALYLDATAKSTFTSLLNVGEGNSPFDSSFSMDCDRICQLDHAILSRVIRLLYESARGDRKNLTMTQTEAVIHLLAKTREKSSVSLSDGFCAGILNRRLHILSSQVFNAYLKEMKTTKETVSQVQISIVLPSDEYFGQIKRNIKIKYIENHDELDYNAFTWCFSEDILAGAVWRYRREGDLIRPNKRSGRKSLKKWMIDEKIPAGQRDELLLLARDNEILWIPGVWGIRYEEDNGIADMVRIDAIYRS